jgi:hypothetical protein
VIKHVLLVQPPQPGLLDGFANGLVDLANFISPRLCEVKVKILDLGLIPVQCVSSALEDALRTFTKGATLIGITTTTATYQSALSVARAAKRIDPSNVVVLGGHHASPQHDVILRHHAYVDFVVRGEGEYPLLKLIRGDRVDTIPSISFRASGGLIANVPGQLLTTEELDSLGVDFKGQIFESAPGKFNRATYVSARGCPLRCAFCAVAGETIRSKSIGKVIEDLFQLVFVRGHQRIAIEDNFFAQKKSRTLPLCDEIQSFRQNLASTFTWDCQTRVESLYDFAIIRALAKAGCDGVYLGVEGLSSADLLYLGKTAQPERYLEALSTAVVPNVLGEGVACNINLQVGLPEETQTSLCTRVTRLEALGRVALRSHQTLTVFPQLNVIYPGTAHFWKYVQEQRFGALGLDVFESFTEWEAEHQPTLRFLGENFAHGVGGIPIGILDQQELRGGKFVIDQHKVDAVREHLNDIGQVAGISLFRYGAYLTRTDSTEKEARVGI